jgi:hypothetical protein
MPTLIVTRGTAVTGEYFLDERGARIGRAPDNDIRPDDTTVSRWHAMISWLDGSAFVQDLGSRNGTLVNGAKIEKRALTDGDVIQIGRHHIRFVNDSKGRAGATAASSMPVGMPAPPAEPVASIRKMTGPDAGMLSPLAKAFTPVGAVGHQVFVIARRGPGYSLLSFGAGTESARVNGKPAALGTYLLRDRDVIEVAANKFEFVLVEPG